MGLNKKKANAARQVLLAEKDRRQLNAIGQITDAELDAELAKLK